MSITSLTLMMIVRNEAQQIERCLQSCLPFIDRWIIVDTGSTDQTKEIIQSTLQAIPGELYSRTWVNFGVNRTELLRLYEAKYGHADIGAFALLLDADQTLAVHDPNFREEISDGQQFLIRVHRQGIYEYRMPYLVRMTQEYSYIGSTHEFLTLPHTSARINYDGISVTHHGDGGSKKDKYQRDKQLLQSDLQSDPNNSRTHFYLAQTLKDLGDNHGAITHYTAAAELSGWHEERCMSRLRISQIYQEVGDTSASMIELMRAMEASPHRSEPYYYLGKNLNALKLYQSAITFLKPGLALPPHSDILFVEKWIDDYGMLLEYAVSLWWLNRKEDAASIFNSLLLKENLPNHIRELVKQNLELCS